jgi:hypothetical protein
LRETVMASSPAVTETRYDLLLISAGPTPRRVAWTMRRADALELLQKAPVLILECASYETAEGARQALKARGATVELRPHEVVEVSEPSPDPAPSSPEPFRGSQAVLITVAIIALVAFIVLMVFLSALGSGLSQLGGICNPECL